MVLAPGVFVLSLYKIVPLEPSPVSVPFNKLLTWVGVPVIVMVDVPEPLTAAPLLPAVAVSTPSPTDNVAVILVESESETDNPVPCKVRFTCSVA